VDCARKSKRRVSNRVRFGRANRRLAKEEKYTSRWISAVLGKKMGRKRSQSRSEMSAFVLENAH
jgi:hypothetical protein